MTRPAATAAETDLHERMHAAHMYGLWELASQMTRHPEPKAIPYMWKAFVLDAMVREAGEAVPVGEEWRALTVTPRRPSASSWRGRAPTPPSTASASTWRPATSS